MKLLVIGKEERIKKYVPDPELLRKYDVAYVPVGVSDEELLEKGKDADFILTDAMGRVSKAVISSMPNLKLIQSEGVGYQGVDTKAAKEAGVTVCNCKGVNAAAVAEQALLLMLGLLRNICVEDRDAREGRQIEIKEGHMREGDIRELGECTLGIVGFGDIGKALARLAAPFGAKIVYYDAFRPDEEIEKRYGVEYMEMDELLSASDIVSLHLPLFDSTRGMASKEFFSKMKEGSYLINTARGELVNSADLLAAIRSGHLAGAGLDTIEGEPVKKDNPILLAEKEIEDKLILSCHVGGITGSTFRRAHAIAWGNIDKTASGQKPDFIVA